MSNINLQCYPWPRSLPLSLPPAQTSPFFPSFLLVCLSMHQQIHSTVTAVIQTPLQQICLFLTILIIFWMRGFLSFHADCFTFITHPVVYIDHICNSLESPLPSNSSGTLRERKQIHFHSLPHPVKCYPPLTACLPITSLIYKWGSSLLLQLLRPNKAAVSVGSAPTTH